MQSKGFIKGFVAGALVAAIGGVTAASAVLQRDMVQEEENIRIATEFYDLLLNQKDWERGSRMIGNRYVQHIHNKRSPDIRGNAVVDMFRIEDGKVVGHWDVVQAIPERALNDNTMF